ncbi:MAG TPA: hypothetical protein VJN71_09340 [Nitrososphaerales archaeon]|nr:hypothetical protein [Nitrososphaerales archaeon]
MLDFESMYHAYHFYFSGSLICSMITYRESYAFDTECKFCAQESELIPEVNTRVCPECYSWLANSVGLVNLGIQGAAE